MCGIAGIIDKKNSLSTESLRKRIKDMTDVAQHRGPDGEGFYQESCLALGHRRLAIIDLSADGIQPMFWLDKYVITFNGEIYNYLEIRDLLQAQGYVFSTKTDTEVILASYDCWGEDCVLRFNGMWAFAIHNRRTNQVFCSRDRFGVKPFYFTQKDDCFLFGSEIKQLLTQVPVVKANVEVLVNYLALNLFDYDESTFFQNIYKLMGGHNLIYDLSTHTFSIKQYYAIAFREDVSRLNEQDSIDCFTQALARSVRYRLRSDVKVGTSLSGGLDSSAIAAIANAQHKMASRSPFCAITASSTQPEFDEYQYAQKVSDHLALDFHVTKPDKGQFLQYLDAVIRAQEYPFSNPNMIMQYFVMKKAKEAGITVLLDGQGGDETLLGYRRYLPMVAAQDGFWRFLYQSKFICERYAISFLEVLKNYFYFTSPKLRLWRQRHKFPLGKPYRRFLRYDLLKTYAGYYAQPFALQKLEIMTTQLPHLLRFEDKNSMAHSVEARLPFMDWELLEISLSLNQKFKLNAGWSKWILRKSVEKTLPTSIVWRKNKIGFNAPVKDWMDNDFLQVMQAEINKSTILRHLLEHIPSRLDYNQRWRLFNIAKWEKAFCATI